jgi:lipoate-protein ligase A
MLDTARVLRAGVPVVRRFSGGGTVLVDSDTQLVSFVFGSAAAPEVPQFPTPLMQWSERFYAGVFEELSDFRLRENGARPRARCARRPTTPRDAAYHARACAQTTY